MKKLIIKNIESNYLEYSNSLIDSLTEQDILELEDKFLTKGFHYIKLRTIQEGRELISLFLKSLNFYKKIAALTVSSQPLLSNIIDLYEKIQQYRYITTDDDFWYRFLLEEFYCDFLWIEATKELLAEDCFFELEEKIEELKIDKEIPIMVITY